MRLFTAVEVPDDIKSTLGKLIDRLRPTAKLNWSPFRNFHVTTKFIGEWPEDRLPEIKRVLTDVPVPAPFEIAVRGLGFFPNARNPRVFWAGIEGPPELKGLAKVTEQQLASLGIPVEQRDFQPHLTLARRRDNTPVQALRDAVENLPSREFGSFRAESFFLYLSAAGKYTQLQEFPFE